MNPESSTPSLSIATHTRFSRPATRRTSLIQPLVIDMFAKLAIYSVALFSVLAAATPVPGLCSTGALQCCNELKSVEEASEAGLLAGILVDVKDLTVPVGIDCSPITVVGLGGGTWYVAPSSNTHAQLTPDVRCIAPPTPSAAKTTTVRPFLLSPTVQLSEIHFAHLARPLVGGVGVGCVPVII